MISFLSRLSLPTALVLAAFLFALGMLLFIVRANVTVQAAGAAFLVAVFGVAGHMLRALIAAKGSEP